jgi:dihydrofolate synthase / folylpolyglutamate synthase
MNYKQAESYLNNFINYENIPGITYASGEYSLKHIQELLRRIGNPHLHSKTVHIAGSKGKGSTAVMIAQVLIDAGYKTGLYTSPHLHNLRERIQINGKSISKKDFSTLIAALKPHFDTIHADTDYRQFTFFEALTVLAFTYFSKMDTAFQVMEVGLGGRLDATNVVEPEVCIITPIGLEHTQILGDTLEKIACEKAGIIKPGSLVVISPQKSEALKVISEVCRQRKASLIEVNQVANWHKVSHDFYHQLIAVQSKSTYYRLWLPLLGDYQLENAATAIIALETLASKGFAISAKHIKSGFTKVNWPGRFQILKQKPTVLVDGAHSVESIRRLIDSLKIYLGYNCLYLIIGISSDKNITGIVKELVSLSPQVITTHSTHPRAAPPSMIAAEFSRYGIITKVSSSVAEAIEEALTVAAKEDLICITGSLFVVSEAIDYINSQFAAKPENSRSK